MTNIGFVDPYSLSWSQLYNVVASPSYTWDDSPFRKSSSIAVSGQLWSSQSLAAFNPSRTVYSTRVYTQIWKSYLDFYDISGLYTRSSALSRHKAYQNKTCQLLLFAGTVGLISYPLIPPFLFLKILFSTRQKTKLRCWRVKNDRPVGFITLWVAVDGKLKIFKSVMFLTARPPTPLWYLRYLFKTFWEFPQHLRTKECSLRLDGGCLSGSLVYWRALG